MPKTKIKSYGVSLNNVEVVKLKNYLISLEIPIITIINEDKLIIDCKLIENNEIEYLIDKLNKY